MTTRQTIATIILYLITALGLAWFYCIVAFAGETIIIKDCRSSETFSDHAVYDAYVRCYSI